MEVWRPAVQVNAFRVSQVTVLEVQLVGVLVAELDEHWAQDCLMGMDEDLLLF